MNLSPQPEWFARPRGGEKPGLRFACTQCGNCCTGPEGYVLISPEEQSAIAQSLALDEADFVKQYTKETVFGRSLSERETPAGLDCVFLDRTSIPGKAVCGIYHARPVQCRTWPFWPSNLTDETAWARAGRNCPGIDRGKHYTPMQIRIERDRIKI
jgi:Fe-S-cluster containining protein